MPATQRKCIYGGLTLDVDRHYIGSVTATTHQDKGIITLESNPLWGTVLPASHGKGNKCDKNVVNCDVKQPIHLTSQMHMHVHGTISVIFFMNQQCDITLDKSLNHSDLFTKKITRGTVKIQDIEYWNFKQFGKHQRLSNFITTNIYFNISTRKSNR